MEENIKTIEELKGVAAHSFHVVKPSKSRKGLATVSIPINSYAELSWYVIDVLKVSVAALEADSEGVGNMRNIPNAVSGVLEKVIEMIPLEEMDLLDKIRGMLQDEKSEKKQD
jgi:hypothetical protein